jgi:hypothetical protein
MNRKKTTSQRQGRRREAGSGGSRRQNREPTKRNLVEGRRPEASEHGITKPRSEVGGKRGGCAVKVRVLTWGDLSDEAVARRPQRAAWRRVA